ncbi:unnamed protein product [Urochloa decumbens]|uniref:RING-type E3 ubiquitin transferase n=1 Tax=Urochloa decumbens TaxID=240449 RepID=A0ABC9E9T0_9POAL
MSSSPAFPSPYAPPPQPLPAALGLSAALGGSIVVMLAFKYFCKVISADTEPLRHQGSNHAAASPATERQQPPPRELRNGEQLRHGASLDRPRLAVPMPSLPAFVYNRRSLQSKAADAGEEAAACSVCLGAFESVEIVKLLPVCLHLYHAECIDPGLRKHSTCPVCRSETDPAMVMNVSQLPHV